MSRAMVRRIRIEPGAWVTIQGRRACIVQVLDLETVVVQDTEREETWAAKICDLHAERINEKVLTAIDWVPPSERRRRAERLI